MYSKQMIMALALIFIVGVAASSGEELSAWQDIKNSMTNILRNLGLPRAGEPCLSIGNQNRCVYATNDVSFEEVPFLECDPMVGIKGVAGAGICNVKSWIVFLTLVFIAAIPISFILCICCFCCRCR